MPITLTPFRAVESYRDAPQLHCRHRAGLPPRSTGPSQTASCLRMSPSSAPYAKHRRTRRLFPALAISLSDRHDGIAVVRHGADQPVSLELLIVAATQSDVDIAEFMF